MDSSQLINFLNAFIFRDIDEEDDDDLLDLVERSVEVLLFSLKLQDNKLAGIDGMDVVVVIGFAVGVVAIVLSNNEVLMTVLVDSMDVVNVVLLIK